MDLAGGRRNGTLADYANGVRLCQAFEVIQVLGAVTEPQDITVECRQLEMLHAQLTLSDKIPHTYCRGHAQVADCLEQVRIACGAMALGLVVAASGHAYAGHENQMTFSRPVALPGVVLPAGAYSFDLVDAKSSMDVVVVRNPQRLKSLPEATLRTAAEIAAFYSGARQEGKAEVHYTQRKHVHKRKGMPSGQVLLRRFRSVQVAPRLPGSSAEEI